MMSIFSYLALLVAGGVLLWKGADWIVDSAAAIARRFGISELVIGLTIVAMGTSLPEFLVTFTAALKGLSTISLANVVGSNIFNLGIILGIMAIIKPVQSHKMLIRRDGPLLLATVTIIWLLSRDLELSHVDGAILSSIFFGYLGWMMLKSKNLPEGSSALPDNSPAEETENDDEVLYSRRTWAFLLGGIVAVGAGSQFMVEGASGIARAIGVSEWLIGLTIVAAGTSLPELVTCLAASLKGRNAMLLGNLIGSDFFNFAGVLGLTSLFNALNIQAHSLQNLQLSILTIAVVLFMMRSNNAIGRKEGIFLVGIGILRWTMEFL